jgi:hypothetical protein
MSYSVASTVEWGRSELTNNILYVFTNHKFPIAVLIYIAGHYVSSRNQTNIYTAKSYQSVALLFNFKIESDNLSENNSVYLTKFKFDEFPAVIRHLI